MLRLTAFSFLQEVAGSNCSPFAAQRKNGNNSGTEVVAYARLTVFFSWGSRGREIELCVLCCATENGNNSTTKVVAYGMLQLLPSALMQSGRRCPASAVERRMSASSALTSVAAQATRTCPFAMHGGILT